MATAAESAYAAAVNKAAGVKQNSYAIALAAYAPNGSVSSRTCRPTRPRS